MERYRSIVHDSARWEGFRFRPGDIVISTPPKAGTTWTQMICALLIFQDPVLHRPLSEISPWLDMLTQDRDTVVQALEAQQHRRFVKTHTPLPGLPFDERVTYICVGRDPRDAGMSWDNHMMNLDLGALMTAREAAVGLDDLGEWLSQVPESIPQEPRERFRMWVDDPTPPTLSVSTLQAVIHHLDVYWAERHRPNVVLLHYADLQADLEAEMRRLAALLDIDVPEGRWPALVEAAGFEQMRSRADELVPDAGNRIWQDTTRFFHRGETGQWRSFLDDGDLRHYEERVAELSSSPDLATWAHHGAHAPAS